MSAESRGIGDKTIRDAQWWSLVDKNPPKDLRGVSKPRLVLTRNSGMMVSPLRQQDRRTVVSQALAAWQEGKIVADS
jgi:hypothetical protein